MAHLQARTKDMKPSTKGTNLIGHFMTLTRKYLAFGTTAVETRNVSLKGTGYQAPTSTPAFKKELPRVDGKVFVITGTTSGTGYVAAQTVAEKGGDPWQFESQMKACTKGALFGWILMGSVTKLEYLCW